MKKDEHARFRTLRNIDACMSLFYFSGSSRRRRVCADQRRAGTLAQRNPHHDVLALRAFRCGPGVLCMWLCMAGIYWEAGAHAEFLRQGLELDRRGTILLSRTCAGRLGRLSGCVAANFLRRFSGCNSAGERRRSLASACELPFDGTAGGMDISAFRAL